MAVAHCQPLPTSACNGARLPIRPAPTNRWVCKVEMSAKVLQTHAHVNAYVKCWSESCLSTPAAAVIHRVWHPWSCGGTSHHGPGHQVPEQQVRKGLRHCLRLHQRLQRHPVHRAGLVIRCGVVGAAWAVTLWLLPCRVHLPCCPSSDLTACALLLHRLLLPQVRHRAVLGRLPAV